MEIVYPRCCGLDVHQASVCACISIKTQDKVTKHKRRFATNTEDLRALVGWLFDHGVTHVAMEATGVYWKPVWNVLEEGPLELAFMKPATWFFWDHQELAKRISAWLWPRLPFNPASEPTS